MKQVITTLFFVLLLSYSGFSQSITGVLEDKAGQRLFLKGFRGFNTYPIDSTVVDDDGKFQLDFKKKDYGMGYLQPEDGTPHFVILSPEDTGVKDTLINQKPAISFTRGPQNRAFERYAISQPKREQVLAAWSYLQKTYQNDDLFARQPEPNQAIREEMQRLAKEEQEFLARLPEGSYVKWFLPIRKLVSNVSVIAQYRPEEIPATLTSLREMDYSDARLYKSGLFKEALENHVWFIENSSGSLETVFQDLNTSMDLILAQLEENPKKYNEVTEFLFNLLEERSLFTSSEYLAVKVLNQENTSVEDTVARQLERYGRMKTGNRAPDIQFTKATYYPEHTRAENLYSLTSDYTLVVFAAGWCPYCTEEIPKIAEHYPAWQEEGLEVVMVSLDESPEDFVKFAAPLPFISTTDYGKWESRAVEDYYVSGTPSMFLLDKDQRIVLRPKSVEHLEAWVKANLQQ